MKKITITILTLLVLTLLYIFSPEKVLSNSNLIDRVSGHILLQVEENGEAWYVYPKNNNRYYLRDGWSAYRIMKELGLGITNDDLYKITIGIMPVEYETDSDDDGLSDKLEESIGTDVNNSDTDSDGYIDSVEIKNGSDPLGIGIKKIDYSLVDRLRGMILLQVESRGEAWYLNPTDGKRYYMYNGISAYKIMRGLSVGITNRYLERIHQFDNDKRLNDVDSILMIYLRFLIDNREHPISNLEPGVFYMIGSGQDATGCDSADTTQTIDLSVLENGYISKLPMDPDTKDASYEKTYYYIYRQVRSYVDYYGNKRKNDIVYVGACNVDLVNGKIPKIQRGY